MAIKIVVPQGKKLELEEFVCKYSKAYFLGKNKIDGIRYQQTWEDGEGEILKDHRIKDFEIFKKIMAWKIGRISHKRSYTENKLIYYRGWDDKKEPNPQMYGKTIQFKEFHQELMKKKNDIENYINKGSIEEAFDKIMECKDKVPGSYIGPVYAITILCFMSNGKFPIYDRFVLTSLKAIEKKRFPIVNESRMFLDKDSEWILEEYKNYYIPQINCLLNQIGKKTENHLGYRELDRALWVYGHGFKE